MSRTDPIYRRIAYTLVEFINSLVVENSQCALRKLLSIEWVTQQRQIDHIFDQNENLSIFKKPITLVDKFYKVLVMISPGYSLFEGTVTLTPEDKILVAESNISRISAYGDEPKCVVDTHPYLRKYCFCKSLLNNL